MHRGPVLVFDYVNRVAGQLGKDAKTDSKITKTLAERPKATTKPAGGRPAAS